MADNIKRDDHVQHGIDDSPSGDAEKGATLGGIGGAVTGAIAGSAAGPVGTLAGAIIGGVSGAVASGAAVAAVDRHDNDNTVSGIGHGATTDIDERFDDEDDTVYANRTGTTGMMGTGTTGVYNNDPDGNMGMNRREELGETMPSIKTGGYANDGTPDTRGVGEKVVDAVTGDPIDDKTGKTVYRP